MKNILVLAYILVITNIYTGYSQWERITGFDCIFNHGILTDSNTIWGCGNLGKVFKYSIDENSFKYKEFNDSLDFYSLAEVNDSVIIFAGWNWYTHNGILVQYNHMLDTTVSFIKKSHMINDVKFLDAQVGFAVSFNGIHRTSDGGRNWSLIWDFSKINADYGELFSITIDKDNNIYSSGQKKFNDINSNFQGLILKSNDTGEVWEILYQLPDERFDNIQFLNGNLFCHSMKFPKIYFSDDMGLSWIEIQSPIDEPLLRIVDVEFLNDDTLFVCISQTYFFEPSAHPYTVDLIVRSSDGGNSWGVQFENYPRHPPKDTSLVQIISVNDSLLISIGYKLLIKTENSGGPVWPVKHVVELKSSNVHRIFPNPAGNKLYASNLQKKCSFSIIDLSGKTLLLGDLEPGNYINIETLNNGIYLIKLFSKQDIILTDIFIKN